MSWVAVSDNHNPLQPSTARVSIERLLVVCIEYARGSADVYVGADIQKLSAAAAITDGPNESVYGLNACFEANVNAQKLPGSTGTVSFADPYAVLAKGR